VLGLSGLHGNFLVVVKPIQNKKRKTEGKKGGKKEKEKGKGERKKEGRFKDAESR
jgi:hypothetical protein